MNVMRHTLDLKENSFPGQRLDWDSVLNVAAAITPRGYAYAVETFQFLAMRSVASRVSAIGVKSWRDILENNMATVRKIEITPRKTIIFDLRYAVRCYEMAFQNLKEATTTLELALWKWKIDEYAANMKMEDIGFRLKCHVSCGSDIIVGNVVPFLVCHKAIVTLNRVVP